MRNKGNNTAYYRRSSYGNLIIFLFVISAMISFAACSTGSTRKNVPDLSAITQEQSYQVRVRTGNLAMDRLVYDYASRIFGGYVPIAVNDNYSGVIEIVFTSTSDSLPAKSSASYKTNVVYGNSWFTGNQLTGYPVNDEISRGGLLTWLNSKMSLAIKNPDGRLLWHAEYAHKGGEKYKDILVKTADEAAYLCIDRIISMFRNDFNLNPVAEQEKTVKILPTVALVIKEK